MRISLWCKPPITSQPHPPLAAAPPVHPPGLALRFEELQGTQQDLTVEPVQVCSKAAGPQGRSRGVGAWAVQAGSYVTRQGGGHEAQGSQFPPSASQRFWPYRSNATSPTPLP